MDHPWPAGLAPAGDDCVITACWYQDEVWREDSIRIGAVLEKWEDGGRQAGIGAAGAYRFRYISNGIVCN